MVATVGGRFSLAPAGAVYWQASDSGQRSEARQGSEALVGGRLLARALGNYSKGGLPTAVSPDSRPRRVPGSARGGEWPTTSHWRRRRWPAGGGDADMKADDGGDGAARRGRG